jgi:hypothetical protein
MHDAEKGRTPLESSLAEGPSVKIARVTRNPAS